MAASVVVRGMTVAGNRHIAWATVTGDTSYVTGGYLINPRLFGMVRIEALAPSGFTSDFRGVVWDAANSKLKWVEPTQQTGSTGNRPGVEVANGTNLSSSSVLVTVVGA